MTQFDVIFMLCHQRLQNRHHFKIPPARQGKKFQNQKLRNNPGPAEIHTLPASWAPTEKTSNTTADNGHSDCAARYTVKPALQLFHTGSVNLPAIAF